MNSTNTSTAIDIHGMLFESMDDAVDFVRANAEQLSDLGISMTDNIGRFVVSQGHYLPSLGWVTVEWTMDIEDTEGREYEDWPWDNGTDRISSMDYEVVE